MRILVACGAVNGGHESAIRVHRTPVPASCLGVGLVLVAAHVEPHRRIECPVLVEEQERQLIGEDLGVLLVEISLGNTGSGDGLHNAANKLINASLALGGFKLPVEILADHDVGCGHRPAFGNAHALLFEDHFTFEVGDPSGAFFPLDGGIRIFTLGEVPIDLDLIHDASFH